MGPLSAVAISFWLALDGLTGIGSITASAHFLGWVGLIVAAVVLFDAFIINSGHRWSTWRNRERG